MVVSRNSSASLPAERPGRAARGAAERKDPGQRAAEIRAAARDLALSEGLPAVTLRGVAARAGVTPGLVGHYVASMDALVAEAFTAITGEELDEIRAQLEAHADPVVRLRALIGTMLDDRRRDVTAVWVDAWSMGRRSELLAGAVRAQMDAWQEFVYAEITAGIGAGRFHAPDPDAAAWQLIGMVDGLNAQALVRYRDSASRGRLLARALESELGLTPGALQS